LFATPFFIWAPELCKAYSNNNILQSEIPDWVSNREPMPLYLSEGGHGGCCIEEFLCAADSKDPGCTSSPYKESNHFMKTGVVTGFTILGLAIAAAVAYVFQKAEEASPKGDCPAGCQENLLTWISEPA
jgi:hypothetical protein